MREAEITMTVIVSAVPAILLLIVVLGWCVRSCIESACDRARPLRPRYQLPPGDYTVQEISILFSSNDETIRSELWLHIFKEARQWAIFEDNAKEMGPEEHERLIPLASGEIIGNPGDKTWVEGEYESYVVMTGRHILAPDIPIYKTVIGNVIERDGDEIREIGWFAGLPS